ncbi:MAG: HAMP domain-containing histidine kinase [Deltaproteobacteria bacterium]|jgi:signal transduction histidine kinase/ActR/RegA family two-component response regulator|nr:HAMP domain-containing histidine kinase [Deltaproteobacteria bacterium]MBW2536699.1 HAMP domain-containing histidine kinase [Deltaproteobacteria bacterium]
MAARPNRPSDGVIAQRDALLALSRSVVEGQGGGVLSTAVEVVARALGASGAVAYRLDDRDLKLVAEQSLPPKAKPWLARLPLDEEPWFVAQTVATSGHAELADGAGGAREGHSAQGPLTAAGWELVVAAPISVGREVLGVLVVGVPEVAARDAHARSFVETASNILALALLREGDVDRRREDRLREAKTAQLATIGLLASTVACDLASPLGRLQLQVDDQEQLLRELGQRLDRVPDELGELVELTTDVAAGVRRAQAITTRLLGFSETSKLETLDLGELAREVGDLMRDAIQGRGISLELSVPSEPLRVVGRRESLQLLLVQLLLHVAGDSGSSGVPAPRVRLAASAEPTGNAVSFESSAAGRAASRGASAFDTFLTRNLGDESVDLGLGLAKQAVLAHNGHIELGPSELGGALIRVLFPSSRSAVERRRDFSTRPSAEVAPGEGPVPAVVWIDDDDLFVRGLRRYLKSYAVHAARSVAEAKLLLRGLGEVPELVFCNLGAEADQAIAMHRAFEPDLADRFVFLTGGVLSAEVAHYLIASRRPTLIKPIALEEVADLLQTDLALSHRPSIAPTLDGTSRPPPGDDDGPDFGRRSPTTLRDGSGAKRK